MKNLTSKLSKFMMILAVMLLSFGSLSAKELSPVKHIGAPPYVSVSLGDGWVVVWDGVTNPYLFKASSETTQRRKGNLQQTYP